MRSTAVVILASLLLFISGCSARNVAVVTDTNLQAPKVWDNLSHQVSETAIAEEDRLVILRVSHKNPLLFRNELNFRQYPKGSQGRSSLTIYPEGEAGDVLVLLKFKADAGETAYIQPMPCKSSSGGWCVFTSSPEESHATIVLPPPRGLLYAGHLHYEIQDQFPHRGTQSHPLVKQLTVTNAEQVDLPAAMKKWPLLKKRIAKSNMATVHNGRAKVFVVGSKEFKE